MKKFFSILSLIALTSLATAQLLINNQQSSYWSKQDVYHAPRMLLRILLDRQVRDDYCLCACLQSLFRYHQVWRNIANTEFTQEYIFQQIANDSGVILPSWDPSAWINDQYRYNDINYEYARNDIPRGFGSNTEISDMRMFESFIISSLRQNAPIILVHANEPECEGSHHAIIVNGVEPHENISETIFYYQDPENGSSQLQFRGSQIRDFFTNGDGYILGVNNNFDFYNRFVNIRLANQTFFGNVKNQSINLEYSSINLTKQAGVTEFSELVRYGIIELTEFNVRTTWFNIDFHFEGENLITRYIAEGEAKYKKRSETSWNQKYRNIARAEFETYYLLQTEIKDDGDFYIKLMFRFFVKVFLTTVAVETVINLGTQWIMKY